MKTFTDKYENGGTFYDYYIPMVRYIHKKEALLNFCSIIFKLNYKNNVRDRGFLGYQPKNSIELLYKDLNQREEKIIKIDTAIYNQLIRFIKTTQQKGIKLVLVRPPEFYKGQKKTLNKEKIISTYEDICKEYDIPFIDYSKDSICYKPDLFFGIRHLNAKGADIYTKNLIKKVKPLLKSN